MNHSFRTLRVMAGVAGLVILAACSGGSLPATESRDLPEIPPSPGGGGQPSQPWEETWQGTTTGANPSTFLGLPAITPCSQPEDPTCGHHRLVIPADVRQALIVIHPDQETLLPPEIGDGTGASTNDYTLMVYDDRNQLVAYSESPSGSAAESVVIDNKDSAYFDVRVSPFLVAPGSTFTGVARSVDNQPISDPADCLEAVPENGGIAGITDDGSEISLDVEVLIDGTSRQRAAEVMAKAAESYAPLNIKLNVVGMRDVHILSMNSSEIIEEIKVLSNGRPPEGADIVVAFTNKEMQSNDILGATTVIGQADCIGGIRYPSHSFAVVSDVTDIEGSQIQGLPLYPNMDAAAETMAHEIGHLMGAHHHYGNCVEGNLTSAGPGDVSPCTLMFPAVNGASLNFGAFEGIVVRGHAVEHAGP
jgi:hypothetical protein